MKSGCALPVFSSERFNEIRIAQMIIYNFTLYFLGSKDSRNFRNFARLQSLNVLMRVTQRLYVILKICELSFEFCRILKDYSIFHIIILFGPYLRARCSRSSRSPGPSTSSSSSWARICRACATRTGSTRSPSTNRSLPCTPWTSRR